MAMAFDSRSVDRLADSMSALLHGGESPRPLPIDVYRTADHVVLHCDLPGVDPGTVSIDVDNKVLTLRAERTARGIEGVEWMRRERQSGTFVRQLALGDGLDTERITATYDNGVLTLTLPLAERAKPRRIPVMSGTSSDSGAPVIEGETAAA